MSTDLGTILYKGIVLGEIRAIVDRMKQVINASSYEELARFLGISKASISKWIERNKIPEKNIYKFINSTNVNKDWLLTGKGDPYPDSANINIVEGQQGINQQGKSNQINNPNISLGQPNKKEELSKAIRIDDPLTLSILQALEKLTEKQKAEILLQIYKMGDQEK